MNYQHHLAGTAYLNAKPDVAFEYLNDPKHLSSHMGNSSVMMAGSKMNLKLDDKSGKGVGAEIVLEGKMMGLPLFVREYVTESSPPSRKVWETQGPQKMIVIDQYRMGFELSPSEEGSTLKVFIDYTLPASGANRFMGLLLGHVYAKWCTETMLKDAAKHFKN